MQPSAHRSAAYVIAVLLSTSGDTYSAVPTKLTARLPLRRALQWGEGGGEVVRVDESLFQDLDDLDLGDDDDENDPDYEPTGSD